MNVTDYVVAGVIVLALVLFLGREQAAPTAARPTWSGPLSPEQATAAAADPHAVPDAYNMAQPIGPGLALTNTQRVAAAFGSYRAPASSFVAPAATAPTGRGARFS